MCTLKGVNCLFWKTLLITVEIQPPCFTCWKNIIPHAWTQSSPALNNKEAGFIHTCFLLLHSLKTYFFKGVSGRRGAMMVRNSCQALCTSLFEEVTVTWWKIYQHQFHWRCFLGFSSEQSYFLHLFLSLKSKTGSTVTLVCTLHKVRIVKNNHLKKKNMSF